MPIIPKMSPPESLGEAISPIANLSDDEFKKLNDATSTRRSFSLKPKVVKELTLEVAALGTNLPFTLGALSFLYSKLEAYRGKAPLQAIVTQLVEDFDVKCGAEDRQKLETRLSQLLVRNDSFEVFRRVQRLGKGFLPNAIGFRSFVDLRPDFGAEENLKFNGFVKVIQFRIRTDGANKKAKEFVFQVSEDSLDEMQKTIDRARDKLRSLQEIPSIADHLVVSRE